MQGRSTASLFPEPPPPARMPSPRASPAALLSQAWAGPRYCWPGGAYVTACAHASACSHLHVPPNGALNVSLPTKTWDRTLQLVAFLQARQQSSPPQPQVAQLLWQARQTPSPLFSSAYMPSGHEATVCGGRWVGCALMCCLPPARAQEPRGSWEQHKRGSARAAKAKARGPRKLRVAATGARRPQEEGRHAVCSPQDLPSSE